MSTTQDRVIQEKVIVRLQHALASEHTSTMAAKMALWLVLIAVCRSNKAFGTLKVGRWSRRAGGCCIRCSFCVELFVHGKNGH